MPVASRIKKTERERQTDRDTERKRVRDREIDRQTETERGEKESGQF